MEQFINKIKSKAKLHRNIIENFSYLSVIQIFNMLIPLATYPYLIRVLGKDIYGLVIFAQAIVAYLLVLVTFGFTTSAIKEVSINRDNKDKLSEIFSSILILKIIFFVLAFILLAIILKLIPFSKGHESLFYLSMWVCLNEVIFPLWYFLGIEKMKYIAIITLISRSIFLILIFVFINSPEHYIRVPIISGIGALVAGIGAVIVVYRSNKVRLIIPQYSQIKYHFKKSIPYFISEVSVTIFINSNKVILGTTLGIVEVAYYDLAEKVISVFRTLPLGIVRNSIFPQVAKTKNLKIVFKTTVVMTIFSIIAVLLINIFASEIILFLGGNNMNEGVNALRLFSFAIITAHLSNYYLTVGLWSLDFVVEFRNIMISSSIIYIIFLFILWLFDLIGLYSLIINLIAIDVYQFFCIIYIYNNKIKNHKK